MSNQHVVMFDSANGGVSSRFQPLVAAGAANDLGEGIRGSYGIVSIKAGRFRIKYKGQEQVLMDHSNPQQPRPVGTIDVVIVKANPFLNKQFYAGKYTEGANSPPDCYSLDGKVPSPSVAKPQHTSCALCPKNQFGSLIGDNGTKQKACRDTKKLAIVPLADIRNAALGGPMLFRVPPSSLKELSTMADALKARGYPYNSVAVRIGFDLDVSHPKPTFQALRPLTDAEADVVVELYNSDGVERVLADNDVVAEPAEPVAAAGQFIQEPPAAQSAPVFTPPPAAAPPPAQTFVPPPPPPAQPAPQAPPATAPVAQVGAVAVTPFSPGALPTIPSSWGAPVQASPTTIQLQPEPPVAAPVEATPAPRVKRRPPSSAAIDAPAQPAAPTEAPPDAGTMGADIDNILKGLSAFTGGK